MASQADIILDLVPFPTAMDARAIREQLSADIRRRAFFSARMTSIGYLTRLNQLIAAYADGRINAADVRARSLEWLLDLGADGTDPSLTNPASERRLNLIIDTNRQMANNVARIQSQDSVELALYPAWSLERTNSRRAPRDDWQSRWFAAGNACGWNGAVRTRFVALKTSPIWEKLGEGAGGFDDALGNPYPPFAYSSGMNWVDIDADEAQALGLDLDHQTAPAVSLAPSENEIKKAMARTGLSAADIEGNT